MPDTRPDKYCDAVRHEFLSDLKSDSLIGACDQGDAFVWHDVVTLGARQRSQSGLVRRWSPVEVPVWRPRDFRGDGRPTMCPE